MSSPIAQIEVSHIVPGIKYVLIEHIDKHILLPPQTIINYLHQNTILIDPSFTMVYQTNIFMLVEFVANA